MDELYRELLWFLFSIIMLLLGLYLIYLKLYDKNSITKKQIIAIIFCVMIYRLKIPYSCNKDLK